MRNPSAWDCECNKAFKTDEYLNIRNCFCEKRLIDELVLICGDAISNTTKTFDKKVTCEKSNWFVYTISSVIICFLYYWLSFMSTKTLLSWCQLQLD